MNIFHEKSFDRKEYFCLIFTTIRETGVIEFEHLVFQLPLFPNFLHPTARNILNLFISILKRWLLASLESRIIPRYFTSPVVDMDWGTFCGIHPKFLLCALVFISFRVTGE